LANQLRQPCWFIDSSAVLQTTSRHSCIWSNKNIMAAQASSSTQSCHLAIKHYWNCSLNLLFHRLVASHAFACEGEDVVVARSCKEKDVAVNCLFWRILPWWCVTIPKTIIFLRLPQMTKYCVMRECDNIHSWISTIIDLASSHQQEFTVLNSQKGFWRSLPEISLFWLLSLFY
jgi:hypothetical protein